MVLMSYLNTVPESLGEVVHHAPLWLHRTSVHWHRTAQIKGRQMFDGIWALLLFGQEFLSLNIK